MAVKKPLVVNSGEIGTLLAGDSLNVPTTGVNQIQQTNDEAAPIVIGTPVYNDAADGVKKAKGDAAGTSKVIGLVADVSITNAVAGNIAVDGVLTATTGQWDAAFGTTGGLTFGTVYYLSAATPGLGTNSAPNAAGQYVVRLGIALSTTELALQITGQRILL